MLFPPPLGEEFKKIVTPYWEGDAPDYVKLQNVWNILTGLQGVVLSRLLQSKIGDQVFAGPFRGMQLIPEIMDGHFSPTLLGTYEWELHGAIEEAIKKKYKTILNVGCGFGYYAVGLARCLPDAKIYAYDQNETCRTKCRKLAEANKVQDRIEIFDNFVLDDFRKYKGESTLLVMDVGGGEDTLLRPEEASSLLQMDIIVEIHEFAQKGLSTMLPMRFAKTHQVRVLPNAPFSFPIEKILGDGYLPGHFDNLIATWEGRVGPSPFGVFIKKQ